MQNATRLQDHSSCLLWLANRFLSLYPKQIPYLKHLAKYVKIIQNIQLDKRHARPNLPKSKLFEWERSWLQNKMPDHHLLICVLRINRLSAIYLSVCLPIFRTMPTHWMNQCNHPWNLTLIRYTKTCACFTPSSSLEHSEPMRKAVMLCHCCDCISVSTPSSEWSRKSFDL